MNSMVYSLQIQAPSFYIYKLGTYIQKQLAHIVASSNPCYKCDMKITGYFVRKSNFITGKTIMNVNIQIVEPENRIYFYSKENGSYPDNIYDANNNLIVYSLPPKNTFIGKLWAWISGRYVFYKDNKEILRYLHSSLILLPNESRIEHDYRKYNLETDLCKIYFDENKIINFECRWDFLFETIVIAYNSFWFPYYHNKAQNL